jgi:Cft2 family RNA processing exonuclease
MSFTKDKDSDNYITNQEEWMRIIEYIPTDKKIWAPFYCDGKQKEYFKKMGFEIIHEDEDFFENNKGDVIIDNIPFSKKKQILTRLKELEKPFILIIPSVMLCYKYFQDYFSENLQIIVPKNRIKFKHLNSNNKNYTPPYASFFFCYKMNLKKDLIFI